MTPQTLPMPPSTTIAQQGDRDRRSGTGRATHVPLTCGRERRRHRRRRRTRRRRRPTAWSASAARPSCWRPARPRGSPARPGRAGPSRIRSDTKTQIAASAAKHERTGTVSSNGAEHASGHPGSDRRGPCRSGRSARCPGSPLVRLMPAMSSPLLEDLRDDLAEAERDQREVVAAQPQRRRADDDADERADGAGDDQDEPEVDVDAGCLRPAVGDRRWKVQLSVDEPGHQPAGGVTADRPERDVAEVEQAGVADDDVEAERHDDPDHGLVDRWRRAASRGRSPATLGTQVRAGCTGRRRRAATPRSAKPDRPLEVRPSMVASRTARTGRRCGAMQSPSLHLLRRSAGRAGPRV